MNTIVVVDDSKFFCQLIKKQIEAELPYKVEYATTYAEARQLMESVSLDSIDAALLDFRLPDAPNGEIIQLLVNYEIPSIVMISDITEKIRDFIWSHRVVDYVIKHDKYSIDYIIKSLARLRKNYNTEILVVDDSKTNITFLKKLLEVHGYTLLLESEPKKVLQQVQNNRNIKMVITDYHMPKINGCELAKKLRMQFNRDELVIIGISANGDPLMAANFLKHGADDFITRQTLLAEEFYLRINQHLTRIEQVEELKALATLDYLTGINNRRHFLELSKHCYKKNLRYKESFAFGLIDIDHFKEVNDTYGHHVGDVVIKEVASILKDNIRASDLAGRFGGEEFAIYIDKVDLKNTEIIFNKLKDAVENKVIKVNGKAVKVTISIGICTQKLANLDEIIHEADMKLYQAKAEGRNRVCISAEDKSIEKLVR
ncbi:diguanylate cyclase [Kangiella sp. HZ709]|uniref:GGDEF domain-containing response regulator n=1 Tax=Kangiella sp. HZ709 TaxID=2666328 RepID=UPI0012AFDC91|nr:diguanylate cyclase [Kangiella sp. HZ709]MRX26948.1 diguanylate cyclase [Kangiella sp. HZ709]